MSVYEKSLVIEKTDILNLAYDYIVVTSSKYFDEIKEELLEQFQVEAAKIANYKNFYEKAGLTGKYECIFCGAKPVFWEYYGQDNELVNTMKIIGAGDL